MAQPPDRLATDHQPAPTSLSAVFRDPAARPLATIAAALVVVAGIYQTYYVVTTRGWLVGGLVALAFVLAYQLARRFWAVQNAVVAARLARLELDAGCDEPDDDMSEEQAVSRQYEDSPTDA